MSYGIYSNNKVRVYIGRILSIIVVILIFLYTKKNTIFKNISSNKKIDNKFIYIYIVFLFSLVNVDLLYYHYKHQLWGYFH